MCSENHTKDRRDSNKILKLPQCFNISQNNLLQFCHVIVKVEVDFFVTGLAILTSSSLNT